MTIDRNDVEERETRIQAMIDEFQGARQRRLVKQGIALWNRTEQERQPAVAQASLPPTDTVTKH